MDMARLVGGSFGGLKTSSHKHIFLNYLGKSL